MWLILHNSDDGILHWDLEFAVIERGCLQNG